MTIHGWLIVDKPAGISSSQVVYKLRKILNQKKIGHGGTLDPFATGILPIALGEATKTQNYVMGNDKEYIFTIRFGQETDSLDKDGNITNISSNIPDVNKIKEIIPEFIGDIQQVPPKFSAIKINGKSAYKKARKGEDFELKSREVKIYKLELIEQLNKTDFSFIVKCSKGFYIRSLARDIAYRLNTLSHVIDLRRIKNGKFTLSDALTIDKIEEMSHNMADFGILLPITSVLDDILAVEVNEENKIFLQQGKRISNIKLEHDNYNDIAIISENKLIAFADYDAGQIIPKRVFNY